MSKNKSMKFFRKSHKKRNAGSRSTMSGRIVAFSEVKLFKVTRAVNLVAAFQVNSLGKTFFNFLQEIPMDLTDIKPTIIDCEPRENTLPKPRSFTFDNPAMVGIIL